MRSPVADADRCRRPRTSRSDCHAWGAHPIYHYFASVLGIRPGGFRFQAVDIRPQLGELEHAKGRMPQPNGWIEVDLARDGDRISRSITLPDDTTGWFTPGKQTQPLAPVPDLAPRTWHGTPWTRL